MAVSAGAEGKEIEIVASRLQLEKGPKTQTLVESILKAIREE
jgi:hypothetical protein